MRLLVDGRSLFDGHGGLARYTRSILKALALHKRVDRIVVLGGPIDQSPFTSEPSKVTAIPCDARRESLLEQHIWNTAVHTTQPTLVFAPFHIGAPWRSPIPTVVMIHDFIWRRSSPSALSKIRRELLSRLAIRGCSGVLVPSDATRAQLSSSCKRIRVVRHAVDDVFRSRLEIGSSREICGDHTRRLEVLVIGSQRPHKRLHLLEDLVPVLKRANSEVRICVVSRAAPEFGLSWDSSDLDDVVDVRVNLSDDDLASAYRQSSVVVVLSSVEGFSFPVLEAVAAGTPVVASNIPAHRELGLSNVSLVAAEGPLPWAEAIWRAIERSSEVREGPVDALVQRRWSDVAEETISFFEEVLTVSDK